MTIKWLAFMVLVVVASMWIVYAALRALNGIVYEIRLMAETFRKADEEAEEE